jgi:hypothetical protein
MIGELIIDASTITAAGIFYARGRRISLYGGGGRVFRVRSRTPHFLASERCGLEAQQGPPLAARATF